jgi:hypothetical protein
LAVALLGCHSNLIICTLYVNNVLGQAGHFTLTSDSFQSHERIQPKLLCTL